MDNEQTKDKKAFASIIGKEVNGLLDRLNLAIAAFAVMEIRDDMDDTLNRARHALMDAGLGMIDACGMISSFVTEDGDGQNPTD